MRPMGRLRLLLIAGLAACLLLTPSAFAKACPGGIPPDDTPGEGPGKETFIDIPDPLKRGREYRGEVALFEVPKRITAARLRIQGPRFQIVGTPRYRWDEDETLVKFRFRVTKSARRGDEGKFTMCVTLSGGDEPDEERSNWTFYTID